MKLLRYYRNTLRSLASLGCAIVHYYFVPMGTLSLLIFGLIMCTIWVTREGDPK